MISAKPAPIRKRLGRIGVVLVALALAAATLPATTTAAVPGPAWDISASVYSPTNFIPGDSSGKNIYVIQVTNVGSQNAVGPIVVTDMLPPSLSLNPNPQGLASFKLFDDGEGVEYPCDQASVSCTANTTIHPGERLYMDVPVNVAPDAPPVITNRVSVSGGAPGASDSVETKVGSTPAPFGVQSFETELLDVSGGAETRAGAHPYQLRVSAQFNTVKGETGPPAGNPKNLVVDLPAGLVVNPQATPVRCTEVQLEALVNGEDGCPAASAVGVVHVTLSTLDFPSPSLTQPLYNMVPPQGHPASLAFNVDGFGIVVHLLGKVRGDGDNGLSSETLDAPQVANMSGVSVDLWGNPSDKSHETRRSHCAYGNQIGIPCPTPPTDEAFLTMPSACSGPLSTTITANSWQEPGNVVSKTAQTEDPAGNAAGVTDCEKLSYSPKADNQLSTDQAGTGTGLDFDVDFPNDGLTAFSGTAESTTEKAVVTLPEGVTINPSVGEGLGFCRPDQLKRETTFSLDGQGCPSDSKVGTLHVDTPLLGRGIDGSVYLAQQDDPATPAPGAENPFDTDIALYMILRNATLGVMIKQALKVVPDPRTGQLVATLEDIPQLPFSHFNFHFREGARAALISPSSCGRYTTVARLYPYSAPNDPKTVTSSFEITRGVGGDPCPPAGAPPFHPRFEAGSINASAKAFSPFTMRLTRSDGEQDMTRFSAILPPGVLGKLAGVGKCPDAAIAAARTKTGRQELASPSCPANSLIGHTRAGAGVGDSLTYVPGQVYLGGPYRGDPLSVVAITPALAGPFDAGTVVVREALTLDPETAEVQVDGAGSDPIPHILKGIVLKVRDLRVYVDRPDFIVNPTNCEPSSAKATLFGSYLNVFDPGDDVPVDLATRYQAANCASLAFRPKLSIKLNGGTRRGGHPALKAVVSARSADANIGGAVVTLPRSAFLDQGHIRTICTRVQFAANGGSGGGCPKASQYGFARAFTPLLDEPVEGPVYLRSSNHKLPDLVAALHGIVDVDIVGRIDSFRGGIRSSFETVPDAPVSRFILNMQGGKKGLVVNSRNLCAGTNRADANFTGQNGRASDFNPVVKPSCGGKRKRGGRRP